MANEAFAWPNEPTVTDGVDGADSYNLGCKFSVLADTGCVGVRWRVPNTVETPPGGTHVASIWTVVGETRIAAKAFTPAPGGYQDIVFDSPVTLTASPTEYVVAIHTRHYVASSPTPGSGWLVASPSGNLRTQESRLVSSNGGPLAYPSSVFNSWYYVSPLVEGPGGDPPSAAPSGLSIPFVLGSAAVSLSRTASPTGIALPAAVGSPSVALNRSAAPSGVPVPVALGSPSSTTPPPSPAGLVVPVSVGAPATSLGRTAAPGGVSVPVALGIPAVARTAAGPTGLAVPVVLGQPAALTSLAAAPSGLSVPMSVGQPGTGPPISRSVIRPNRGSVTRPDRGAVARP